MIRFEIDGLFYVVCVCEEVERKHEYAGAGGKLRIRQN